MIFEQKKMWFGTFERPPIWIISALYIEYELQEAIQSGAAWMGPKLKLQDKYIHWTLLTICTVSKNIKFAKLSLLFFSEQFFLFESQ